MVSLLLQQAEKTSKDSISGDEENDGRGSMKDSKTENLGQREGKRAMFHSRMEIEETHGEVAGFSENIVESFPFPVKEKFALATWFSTSSLPRMLYLHTSA
ncbi:hypothetical protein MLD38_032580 [Melastoma candidum]|uniref:Uncharacterized protein n=1 Tax=Melastoma candidum TaxID=119954 RepID=A0ACB9M452_9MYRT|nr:hypothetical protein MLD38_032580 [Melastoma candidum]